jgi:hypothetical protein
VAEAIRLAVDAALTNSVERSGVVPGLIPWDDCSCGMLAVSVGRVFLSDDFPNEQAERISPCDAAWEVAEIVVQVIRCAPSIPEGKMDPTVAAQDLAAQVLAADGQQTLAAITSWICNKRGLDIIDGITTEMTSEGPEGGCVGLQLHALIGLPRG